MIELCGCGHANDHIGRQCEHLTREPGGEGKCPCSVGMRSDIALLSVASEANVLLQQNNMNLMKLLAVVQAASGLVAIVRKREDGSGLEVVAVPKGEPPRLIRPV